jgi:hypothetical protein
VFVLSSFTNPMEILVPDKLTDGIQRDDGPQPGRVGAYAATEPDPDDAQEYAAFFPSGKSDPAPTVEADDDAPMSEADFLKYFPEGA